VKKRPSYRWVILFLLYLEMLFITLNIQFIPPLVPQIMEEIKISHTHAGLLMGLIALPGLFICIPSGIFSDKFGFKKVGIASLLLIFGANLAMSMSFHFKTICVGRILSGIGVMALAITLPHFLSTWFKRAEMGLAMGIFNTAMPVGTILSFSFIGNMGKAWGLQKVIQMIAILALVRTHKLNRIIDS
jgi:MFS family permease